MSSNIFQIRLRASAFVGGAIFYALYAEMSTYMPVRPAVFSSHPFAPDVAKVVGWRAEASECLRLLVGAENVACKVDVLVDACGIAGCLPHAG